MNKVVLSCAMALALIWSTVGTASAGSSYAEGGSATGVGAVRLCLVTQSDPDTERTVRVPSPLAAVLLRLTSSYAGPCAEYGESAPRGDGTLTAYSQQHRGVPISVGIRFPSETLEGLPHDPPTEGRWCYDKNDDGEIDPMGECSGGYENALQLGEHFQDEVDSPFTYALMNWNPHGHMPTGVYDKAHFDVHFYTNPNEERLAIRVGPCEVLVHCDDYPLGKALPDEKYLTEDHQDLDAVEPAMGNHLVDLTGPEHHGEPFTHALIYGVWDREVTFYEPMVTHQWFADLVEGSQDSGCYPIKQPEAWQESGWYPTEYCLRYLPNRDELTASLESFVHRRAS